MFLVWIGPSVPKKTIAALQVIPKHVYVDEGSKSLEDAFKAYRFSLIVDDERSISQALIHSIAWATWWHQVVVKLVR